MAVSVIALALYAGLVGLTGYGFLTTPKGFIPSQDMGYLMVIVQLPDSASMERTREVMRQLDEITRRHPGVKHATTISGQSFALQANGSNFGSMFVYLKEYAHRREPPEFPRGERDRLAEHISHDRLKRDRLFPRRVN